MLKVSIRADCCIETQDFMPITLYKPSRFGLRLIRVFLYSEEIPAWANVSDRGSGQLTYGAVHAIFNNVVCATSKASDQPAYTRSLIRAFASRWSVELLTEHH